MNAILSSDELLQATIDLKTAVDHSKTPLTLRQAQGERDFGMLIKWLNLRKPFVLSLSKHERLSQVPTGIFRINGDCKFAVARKLLLICKTRRYRIKITRLDILLEQLIPFTRVPKLQLSSLFTSACGTPSFRQGLPESRPHGRM